ncbi:N-acetylmuramoyl-L-alanine amidase [Sulfurovum mangrovi]|uniref:N-acetylmuramoyl-L-alanine amidase n=1 Tax=Sulfurovum mangrovi TaxID=2893889 RepID=UPI001E54E641|nr:peptidoglycan recognition family protein [Sulfurovum mangrovi]UFH58253.1 peptidoglycan recognition protein family protein [Sulfurovum mangrovi]
MLKLLLSLISLFTLSLYAENDIKCTTNPIQPLQIIDKPIDFGKERIEMTKAYIRSHYGKTVNNIEITPKIIVLHWTAEMSLDKSFKRLQPEKLLSDRKDIVKASALNVSAHFLVARDGTIYRLMPENWMGRHVIGLNYSSIGIENVGGKGNKRDDLTPAQLRSNIALVGYLKGKFPTIEYLIGHHEYTQMESTPLWLEKDKGYRTVKRDPGEKFMRKVREAVGFMHLKKPPKGSK